MKNRNSMERGQALVVIVLSAVVLFGFVALGIDGTAKFSDRRHAQNAADTAALAGALAYVNGNTNWKVEALDRAADNGYNNNLVSSEVWVYLCSDPNRTAAPMTCGPYEGRADYLEVVIRSHIDTTFARVLGFTQTHNLVQAITYVRQGGDLADGAMLISYDPDPNCSTSGTGGYSVSVSGSSTVNLNGGGIFLNSDEVCGFVIPNCADLNIYGGSINSVGNNIDLGACTFDPSITPNINQDAILIPEDVYWPDVPPECGAAAPQPTKLGEILVGTKTVEEWLIYPGFYTDFPQAALVANKSNIYMASGVYCIDPPMTQDLSWSPVDAAVLNGSIDPLKNKYATAYNPDGVTLYIKAGGGFSINSNSPTFIDASTDGDYQGYLIILEGTHTSIQSCTISGGADLHINGLIFAPYCDITVNGGSDPTAEINAQLIAWNIKINGTTTINFNYDPDNQVTIKRRVGLMR